LKLRRKTEIRENREDNNNNKKDPEENNQAHKDFDKLNEEEKQLE